MNDDELTGAEFSRAMEVQNSELRWVLDQLRAGGSARWRKLRLLQIRCRGCGDTVAEVIDTRPWRILRTRSTSANPWSADEAAEYERKQAELSAADFGRWVYDWRAKRTAAIRQGDWIFQPLPHEGSTSIAAERISAKWSTACSCSRHELLPMGWIYGALDSGIRQLTVKPRVSHSRLSEDDID